MKTQSNHPSQPNVRADARLGGFRSAGVWPAIKRAVTVLVKRLQDYFEVRASRRVLARLSDRQLRDIGLTRADVEALGGEFGQPEHYAESLWLRPQPPGGRIRVRRLPVTPASNEPCCRPRQAAT